MKIHSTMKVLAVLWIVALAAFGCAGVAFAASDAVQHAVTVSVPSQLSIAADQDAFTLSFSDFISGTETDEQLVNYTVKGNNVTKTNGVVTAQLDGLYTNMNLQANVGTYNKTSGTASLEAAQNGFQTIAAASPVSLANRKTDSGTGKTLRGVLPVSYKAVATADLDGVDQTKTLTVSIIDT